MYNKKFVLEQIDELNGHNPVYDSITGRICYPVYLNVGERGWFMYEGEGWWDPPHRIHTSVIKNVVYDDHGRIFVTTQNTRFSFKEI